MLENANTTPQTPGHHPPHVLDGPPVSTFTTVLRDLLPEAGGLDMCLTCGLCASGCPASGLEGLDPRKFLRLIALGLEEEAINSPWVWMCTMCQRCIRVCPMQIDIPQLVYQARARWPREDRPKGIRGSCDQAMNKETNSAMGAGAEDFEFVVADVLEEIQENQPECADLQAPMNKKGAYFFLNQNSREPVTEPDEMVPLWKILNYVGADWTYSSVGWAAENYCMFLADDEAWESIVRNKVQAVENLGAKVWLNTE